MSNPLYSSMNTNQLNKQNLMARVNQLKQQISDPQQYIQQLMNSGKVSQAQYNAAVQKMQQLQSLFK